jgi:hypothetical protein
MYTIEMYARNPEELHVVTSFLQDNHIAFTKKGSVVLDESMFYSHYTEGKHVYVVPSLEFSSLCGKEYLNKQGEIRLEDVFSFLCYQITNPNCFFLESLMETREYRYAVNSCGTHK